MCMRGFLGVVVAWLVCSSSIGLTAAQKPASPAAEVRSPINLNTATLTQLETLPGVGPQTASRIKEYREKNGGFKKVEELMKIKGIGEKAFLKLRGLVMAAPQTAEGGAPGGAGGRQ